jgi:radical SAM-linked protein
MAMAPDRCTALLTFRKTGLLRFLGHLDIARAFDRAIRRAKLPVEYSQGFSPHAHLSFAAPLPVGVAGEAEWCAIDLVVRYTPEAVLKSLGRQLPVDLMVNSAAVVSHAKRSPFADLTEAEYRAELLEVGEEELGAAVERLQARSEFLVHRSTKSRELDLDLKGRILDLSVTPGPTLVMRVCVTQDNLAKPEEVLTLLGEELGRPLQVECLTRTRLWGVNLSGTQ